jgi:hypothetical protein
VALEQNYRTTQALQMGMQAGQQQAAAAAAQQQQQPAKAIEALASAMDVSDAEEEDGDHMEEEEAGAARRLPCTACL